MLETIFYVDEDGSPTGETSEKLAAHHSETKLHAAFSCYVFKPDRSFLVTKRADSKLVWPAVWTNSCCGHPAPQESLEDAIARRAGYELNMQVTDVEIILPDYRYTTPPYNGVIENEYCPLYVAIAVDEPDPNPEEVSDYQWLSWNAFVEQTENDSDDYSNVRSPDFPKWSWWCKDQLKQLRDSKAFKRFLNEKAKH